MPSFLKARTRFFERWQMDTVDQIICEDVRDLIRIIETENVPFLILRLPYRIGSPLSLNALREDIQVPSTSFAKNKKGERFYVFPMLALIILLMPFVVAITPIKMG